MDDEFFPLGQLVVTRGVLADVPVEYWRECLNRHHRCDWGDLPVYDKYENDMALQKGARLVSRYNYQDAQGVDAPLYVITEWDRSATTVLFCSEY